MNSSEISAAADAVLCERRGPVAVVTMNRPRKRNALAPELIGALLDALTALSDDASVRAVVLHGGDHFCVGGDLDSLDMSALEMRTAMLRGQRIIRLLAGLRIPVVAAVSGSAFGAGFSLALACDFVVVDAASTFGAAFGKVGLQPDYGLMWSLPARVGMGRARDILMFCEPVKGEQAKAIGLADRLVEPGQVLSTALAMAQQLAELPPGMISATKSILARAPLPLDTMLAWEADTQALLVGTEDFAEGVKAFGERRAAVFKGN